MSRDEGQGDTRSSMKPGFRFEKLEAGQEARAVNQTVCRLARRFPDGERFAMTSQIRRASISVSSNIAAGSDGSLMETASLFCLASDEKYVLESDPAPLGADLERLAKRIFSLNRLLDVRASETPFRHEITAALDSRPSTLDQA